MKIVTAVDQFLQYIEIIKNYSKHTLENYTRYLTCFLDFTDEEKDITNLSVTDINNYRVYLNRKTDKKGNKLSIKTQNFRLIAIRALLKYLLKNDHEVLAPEKIELAKEEDRTIDCLEREELQRLFQAVNLNTRIGKRDRAIIECLYSTGLRVSELCALNKDQVDFNRKEFAVLGKGKKIRIVFLSDKAATYTQDYLKSRSDNYEPLFISHSNRSKNKIDVINQGNPFRLQRDTVEAIVRKYKTKAGLLKKVTPHTLRHTFATEMLKNGADIRSVQEMLGHSSITTTQLYTHVTNKKLKEIHNKFHK